MEVHWGKFKSLDLVGFSSWSRLGVGINLFTLGLPFYHLSHVAIVARHPEYPWPLLCESNTQYRKPCIVQKKIVDGVQWHEIGPRIRSYRGLVWRYPLCIPLTPVQVTCLSEFLVEMTGRGYDAFGALGARSTLLGVLARIGKKEDLVSLFCSELFVATGRRVGVFPYQVNASGFSPNRAARKAVWCWKTHSSPLWVKRRPCVAV